MTNLGALASNAPVPDTGLSSPNNSAYKLLMQGVGHGTTASASGTKYFFVPNNAPAAGATPGATTSGFPALKLIATELAVANLTTKLLLHASVATVGTGPGVTITTGLYPLTVAAGVYSLGTVVAGSTSATASPGANSIVEDTAGGSTDFSLPSDGHYAFGFIVSGTPSANFSVHARLFYRNV